MKPAILVCTLLAFAVALPGQTKPKDVDGWDKIGWGMTIAQARSVYDIDAQPESNDNWMLLKLNPVKIGGIKMGVQVGARLGVGKITSVRLWSYFGLPSSAPSAGPRDFDTLKSVLIREYGHPDNEELKRGENSHLVKTILWRFPSTSILLMLEQSASLPNLGNIYLDYTASDKNAPEKP